MTEEKRYRLNPEPDLMRTWDNLGTDWVSSTILSEHIRQGDRSLELGILAALISIEEALDRIRMDALDRDLEREQGAE